MRVCRLMRRDFIGIAATFIGRRRRLNAAIGRCMAALVPVGALRQRARVDNAWQTSHPWKLIGTRHCSRRSPRDAASGTTRATSAASFNLSARACPSPDRSTAVACAFGSDLACRRDRIALGRSCRRRLRTADVGSARLLRAALRRQRRRRAAVRRDKRPDCATSRGQAPLRLRVRAATAWHCRLRARRPLRSLQRPVQPGDRRRRRISAQIRSSAISRRGWWRSAGASYDDYRQDLRTSSRLDVSVETGKRFTEQLDASVGLFYERRFDNHGESIVPGHPRERLRPRRPGRVCARRVCADRVARPGREGSAFAAATSSRPRNRVCRSSLRHRPLPKIRCGATRTCMRIACAERPGAAR